MECDLIADAGGTKVQWALLQKDNGAVRLFRTSGINPVAMSKETVKEVLKQAAEECGPDCRVCCVSFFGAGCATSEICAELAAMIEEAFGAKSVSVQSDLAGAAASLLGNRRGVACILGTGSNSCLSDGSKIVQNVPSLGYVLGDEGSGNAIGKALVADFLKGLMPRGIREAFIAETGLELKETLQAVYKQPGANSWLARFAKFAANHIHDEYVSGLVSSAFSSFITRNVMNYPNVHDLPVCFTGSVAWHFSDILCRTCRDHGLNPDTIIKEPIEGLITQWKNNR